MLKVICAQNYLCLRLFMYKVNKVIYVNGYLCTRLSMYKVIYSDNQETLE